MNLTSRQTLPYVLILVAGLFAPFLFRDYSNEIAVLWLMILFASTWDILGGQMGYNSLGNIFFFGAGMYICAVVQIGLYYDVGMYTSGARTTHIVFTNAQYFTGFALGTIAAGIGSAVLAFVAGWIVFGLRGPYFAIGTLGLAIAAAELTSSWEWVGAASGISMPVFPFGPDTQKIFFYYLLFALAFVLLVFLRWLYSTNFGLALNAIRDDEEKAEAMGLHTRRYKRTAWAISAVYLGSRRRHLRQHDRLHRAARHRFPHHHVQSLHGCDGAARRQGHAMGAGHRRGDFPHHQGSDLDLLPRLAVHRARALDRRHHRLLPAGHRRLADGEISQAVRRRGRAQDRAGTRARTPGSRRTRRAPNERRHHRTRKRDEILRRRHRQPRRVADGGARRYHRADRPERLRQDHAVQFHRRLSPDRFRLDPLRRPGDFAAQGAGDRAARHAAHVPDHAHLQQDELHAEHADLDPAPQGGPARHVRARGWRGGGEGRALAGFRRAL